MPTIDQALQRELLINVATEIEACRNCALGQRRIDEESKSVPGAGNAHARIMFIGEAPGKYEAERGVPFVGRAGAYFRQLLRDNNIAADDVFVTNTLCCRPPKNRDPQTEELEACWEHTVKQISIIQPEIIVTVGRFAGAQFIDPLQTGKQKMGDIQATPTWTTVEGRPYRVFPMYHPMAGIYNELLTPQVESNFKELALFLERVEWATK